MHPNKLTIILQQIAFISHTYTISKRYVNYLLAKTPYECNTWNEHVRFSLNIL